MEKCSIGKNGKKKVQNVGILSTKACIGKKRIKSKEIIKTISIRGLQNFNDYDSVNPIKIEIDTEKGNYKYRFIADRLLFSSRIKDYDNTLFINCNGLNNAYDLIINTKVYKLLGVKYLQQISNLNKLKGVSDWVNAILKDSDERINWDHFGFVFETKNLNDLLNFTFSLLKKKESFPNSGIKMIRSKDNDNDNDNDTAKSTNNKSLSVQIEGIVQDLKKIS